ncbi:cytosine deaminase [Kribbella antiqua]|uniref:Cytosine deaminase n=1 Tax=Kribbella antiqua TaxID=2512217 RepID=A0A4R2I809_9ACTN|nr:amidohydrolase family protein [Kribbella antiqua]TCO40491.1 cytosine deaminase [Kribbella antiqua]
MKPGEVISSLPGVRALDGSLVDLTLGEGRIVSVEAATTPSGWRVIPAASEPHAHLDKALTGERVDPEQNDLPAAIAQWRDLAARIDSEDIYDRALRAVRRYVSRGITTIRSHVDLPGTGDPMRGVDALVRLREYLGDRVTLQLVALAGHQTSDDVIEEALARGIDILGGCPHLAPAPTPELTRLLDIAQRSGVPIDLHADEQVPAPELDLEMLAKEVIARGLTQQVTASHCVRLGSLPPDQLAPVLELVKEAGIGIVTLPITNLYLQGREASHLVPRGLTAVRAILDAGIPLAAGGDNLRDPFNPVGRADPFETTALLIAAGHLRPSEALAAVTTGARTVLGLPQVGIEAGRPADLIVVPDTDLGNVLAGWDDTRIVLHGGRVVAVSHVSSMEAL